MTEQDEKEISTKTEAIMVRWGLAVAAYTVTLIFIYWMYYESRWH